MELKCHLLCFNILKEIHTSARELVEKSTEVHRRLSQRRWRRAMVMYEKVYVILKLYGSIVSNVCPAVIVWMCPEFMRWNVNTYWGSVGEWGLMRAVGHGVEAQEWLQLLVSLHDAGSYSESAFVLCPWACAHLQPVLFRYKNRKQMTASVNMKD